MMIVPKTLKFLLFSWLVIFFLVGSCVHEKNEPIQSLSKIGSTYPSYSSKEQIVKLNSYDVIPYLSHQGFVWEPFILPIVPFYQASEANLLLGYLESKDNFILPPQPGSCKILVREEKYQNSIKQLYFFVSSNKNPSIDSESLFLLLDYTNFAPYALIKLNQRGEAHCFLPDATYRLSTNYGSHRKEFILSLDEKDKPIKVQFEKKGNLEIEVSTINNIKNGDLIRIGRSLENLNTELFNNNTLVSTPIDNDIYKASNFTSQKLGIEEVFQTNFLIGETPFNIKLGVGNYKVAVIRKNIIRCLKDVKVEENETIKLECPSRKIIDLESRILNRNEFNYYFDTTFFPDYLNQEIHFKHWFLSQKNRFMPILVSTDEKNNKDQKEEIKFSFLFRASEKNNVKYFPENFTLDDDVNNNQGTIFGTGIENIVQGYPPFSFYTSLRFQFPLEPKNILSHPDLVTTNGAEIKLFEPSIGLDGNLLVMNEQKFRFRVSVPNWNSTNVVEMYVNGKLYNRWILNRGDIALPFSITLNEKTYQDKNFTVRFEAWGEAPLPDLLFEKSDFKPYARSRDYLVTLKER